jgi:hypothetical protein
LPWQSFPTFSGGSCPAFPVMENSACSIMPDAPLIKEEEPKIRSKFDAIIFKRDRGNEIFFVLFHIHSTLSFAENLVGKFVNTAEGIGHISTYVFEVVTGFKKSIDTCYTF